MVLVVPPMPKGRRSLNYYRILATKMTHNIVFHSTTRAMADANTKIICALTGMSGCGKTTIAKEITRRNPAWTWIDQDWFYFDQKPQVTLSSGDRVSNWDCVEAIDWKRFNAAVKEAAAKGDVLVVGFAQWKSHLEFEIHRHVHLVYGGNDEKEIKRCAETRRKSKEFTDPVKIRRDELMVREIVYPFYLHTLREMPIDNKCLQVFAAGDGHERIDLDELVAEVSRFFPL